MTLEADPSWAPLRASASEARKAAYAEHSGFRVGAALEARDGRVFTGCNVENASFPVTICAERVALGAAVTAGARRFERLYLCSDAVRPIPPCGMCRQALAEFAPGLRIVSVGTDGSERAWTLDELLPESFDLQAARGDGGRA